MLCQTAVTDLAAVSPSPSPPSSILQSWITGHNHVMLTWYDKYCRNVNMISTTGTNVNISSVCRNVDCLYIMLAPGLLFKAPPSGWKSPSGSYGTQICVVQTNSLCPFGSLSSRRWQLLSVSHDAIIQRLLGVIWENCISHDSKLTLEPVGMDESEVRVDTVTRIY